MKTKLKDKVLTQVTLLTILIALTSFFTIGFIRQLLVAILMTISIPICFKLFLIISSEEEKKKFEKIFPLGLLSIFIITGGFFILIGLAESSSSGDFLFLIGIGLIIVGFISYVLIKRNMKYLLEFKVK